MPLCMQLHSAPPRTTILTEKQVAILEAIDRYDMWFVAERLDEKRTFRGDQAQVAIDEFKKYMGLIALGHNELPMISPEVDEVWHNFILFTREYRDFCEQIIGQFVHHAPRTSRRAVKPMTGNFITAYTTVFGPVPRIWFSCNAGRQEGDCDSTCGYETRGGMVWLSADCEESGSESSLPPETACRGNSVSHDKPTRERQGDDLKEPRRDQPMKNDQPMKKRSSV